MLQGTLIDASVADRHDASAVETTCTTSAQTLAAAQNLLDRFCVLSERAWLRTWTGGFVYDEQRRTMMTEQEKSAIVTVDMLMADLAVLEDECEGDFAWILERLLIETMFFGRNHSSGFLRGTSNIPEDVPRFLALKSDETYQDHANQIRGEAGAKSDDDG